MLLPLAAVLAMSGAPITGSAQTIAPSLTGEQFVGTVTVMSPNCTPGSASFTYVATGTASGPYPGTFTETGSVTMGPQVGTSTAGNPTYIIESWTANFTITSPVGTVTGTKSLPAPEPYGICNSVGGKTASEFGAVRPFPGLNYTADITFQGAQFVDSGQSGTQFDNLSLVGGFTQEYRSNNGLLAIPVCNQNSQTNQTQPLNNQGCANP
jgi:hypothetical protein